MLQGRFFMILRSLILSGIFVASTCAGDIVTTTGGTNSASGSESVIGAGSNHTINSSATYGVVGGDNNDLYGTHSGIFFRGK